jgi:glycosyltransferase involved in cell wall biosynthesis
MATHGGIGTYLSNLIPRVVAARPQWSFTLLGDPDAMQSLGWSSLSNVRMRRCVSGYYTVAEQVELPLRCPRNTDVYWAPHYNVPLLLRHPLMVTVHDVCHLALPEATGGWLKQSYARAMFSHVGKSAATILFDSEFSRAELGRFATARGRTAVAPLGVDESWFCARPHAPERPLAEQYLVYVGNWKRHKNIPTLLRAFKQVLARIPHRLMLIGRSEGLNADAAIAQELSALGDRVVTVGEISAPELRRWVAHADALVTTSLYEGFGLPPLEAMAAGCPCLVSHAGSLPEVCGDAALYCDPRDESGVAAHIVEIATDAALRTRLTESGRARASEFTWERCAAVTLAELDRVVA